MRTSRFRIASAGRGAAALALALCAGWGAGCSLEPPTGIEGIEKNVELDDLPVPTSFELVSSERFRPPGVDDPDFRSWTATYRGRDKVEDVAPFYVREMRQQLWELQEIRDIEDGGKLLLYFKSEDAAAIKISAVYDSERGGNITQIDARVRPRPIETFDIEEYFRLPGVDGATQPASAPANDDGRGDDANEPEVDPAPAGDAGDIPGEATGEVRPASWDAGARG